MEAIVSTPGPGWFSHPRSNGRQLPLSVEDLYPHEVQDSELTAELAGSLDTGLDAEANSLLPGFEATTWADLEAVRWSDPFDASQSEPETSEPAACPGWCVDAEENTHLGVEHLIRPARGGSSFGYEGNDVEVSVQLEQDHAPAEQSEQPGLSGEAARVVLQLRVNGQEQRAYLTGTEAFELRALIGGLLIDIDTIN